MMGAMFDSRAWLRKRGAGRLLYRYFHRPWQNVVLARTYGWAPVGRAIIGNFAMQRAAHHLQPRSRPKPDQATPPICFLTGSRFIHQTAFCAHSYLRFTVQPAAFEFLSDGTLTDVHAAQLRQLFPHAQVRLQPELDDAVARVLPPGKFPALHAMRHGFVLLRKLTDAMAGQSGYRVFFDSDMLFWSEPVELVEGIRQSLPLYLADTSDDGYTVSRAEITSALGVPIAPGVNSGLVGLSANRIDWDLMEAACAFLRRAPGDRRLLEQTLWAITLGAQNAHPLDAAAYRVVVDPPQWQAARAQTPPPALLHYAWHARLPYVAGEWRRYLALISTSGPAT